MEERKMTEKESLELITSMIQNTRKRMELGAGNVLMSWGYVTTIVALVVGVGYFLSGSVVWFWVWFAIPVIGGYLHYILAKRKERATLVKTVVDSYISGIWAVNGAFFAVLMVNASFLD